MNLISGQSTAVLGSTLIHGNGNGEDITCKLIVPEGMDAKGLTCVVKAIEPLSAGWVVFTIGLTLAVVATIFFFSWRDN